MSIFQVIKLKEGESVARVVRSHWLAYAAPLALALLFVIAPFFFMVPLFGWGGWGLAVFLLSLLAGALLAARTAVLWRWNAFVITSRRIIDIDQRGFFYRVVSEAPYDKIQDVSYRVKGLRNTLLGIGTIVIQTAGATANLELTDVDDPKEIHHLITEKMAAREGGAAAPSSLVGAAAGMSGVEARAFLVELQGKIKEEEGERRFTKKRVDDRDSGRHPLDPE